jgi:hypothetical protein
MQAYAASPALARGAAFSFDSVWFYRDGTRVVPEISRNWLTVGFDSSYSASPIVEEGAVADSGNSVIRKKARAIVNSNRRLSEYLYDPNLAEGVCFFRMRKGMRLEDIRQLIRRISQEKAVAYVHPALILNNRTYAFLNAFELKWKTGTSEAQRKYLLRASHAALDEEDEKEVRYTVDVAKIPFFKALNLLAEDIRVLRAAPCLVEIKPSISARLSLFMSGGNIGDSIPFSLTIAFSERVKIDPSSLSALNLRPQELKKELFDCTFDPYDYAASVTRSPIVITGRLALYAPGEFSLPPVKINYSCPTCPDNTVRSIETEPVLFRVSSIIPKAKSENRLIVPTDPVSLTSRPATLQQESLRYLFFTVLCCVGLIPCAIWAFMLRPRVAAERDRLEERKRALHLAGQLRVLLLATPPAPHWSYLGEVGSLLRDYLVTLYGIDSKYRGGSAGRFMDTIKAKVPPECRSSLSAVLRGIDDSVALESELRQDMEQLQHDILTVVDQTAANGAVRG